VRGRSLFTALAVLAACSRDTAPPKAPAPAASTLPAPAKVDTHDHTPRHGGIVGMAGADMHLEGVAAPDGRVRLYLTDAAREPLPLDGVGGEVTLELPDGDRTLPLRVVRDALETVGPPLPGAEVVAHFKLGVGGKPIEMDFLLPLTAARQCVPVAGRATARTPRCTLDLGRPVTGIAVTPDGTTLLLAAADLGVSAWRMPAGEFVKAFASPAPGPPSAAAAPLDAPSPIAVHPARSEAIASVDGRLFRYEVQSGQLLRPMPSPVGRPARLLWSPDGETLVMVAPSDPAVRVVRAQDGTEVAALPVGGVPEAAAFDGGGRIVAVGTDGGAVLRFELPAAAPPRVVGRTEGSVRAVAFAGARLVAAGDDGFLHVWDGDGDAPAEEVRLGVPIGVLAVAPHGHLVACGGREGFLRLHDLETAGQDERLKWHAGTVTGLVWAGSVLVSSDERGQVALWDLADRSP
jgi:hypothetical protein